MTVLILSDRPGMTPLVSRDASLRAERGGPALRSKTRVAANRVSSRVLGGAVVEAGAGGAHLADALLAHLHLQPGDQLGHRHRPEVAVDPVAHRHRAGGLLLVADHEHVRDLLDLRLADLV